MSCWVCHHTRQTDDIRSSGKWQKSGFTSLESSITVVLFLIERFVLKNAWKCFVTSHELFVMLHVTLTLSLFSCNNKSLRVVSAVLPKDALHCIWLIILHSRPVGTVCFNASGREISFLAAHSPWRPISSSMWLACMERNQGYVQY